MSVPVVTERKSFLPLRLRAAVPVVASQSITTSPSMPSVSENNKNSSVTVGSRVLVNGLKSGTLRYIGSVQFAQGLFCGVELDQPDGKHDGQVKETRYFQCPANHGVFVPRDKVVLASRPRISSTHRPVSRLKAPTMTRSITLSASINQIEHSKSVQLPDIVPNATTTTLPVSLDHAVLNNDQPVHAEETLHSLCQLTEPVEIQPVANDEPCETIETDFTDSVSLILHQLQQDQQLPATRSSSVTISEDGSDDDNESVVESVFDEPNDTTHHSSVSSIYVPAELTKSIQTDISFHSNDQISFTQVQATGTTPVKTKTTVQPIKRYVEPRLVTPVTKRTTTSVIPRKPTIIQPKKGSITKLKLNSAQSVTSLSPPSKVKLSASNSLASSQTDLAKTTNKKSSDKARKISQSIDVHATHSDNKSNENLAQINALEQQLNMQKAVHRSLQTSNEQLVKDYQHSQRQFDLMCILTEFFLNETDQIKQQHQHGIAQARISNRQLQTTIESLQSSHKHDLISLDRQYQLQIETLKKSHEQQLNEHWQQTAQFHHEKTELESRCSSLQEKVDGFLTEMANSAHADVLLCHVETLEKDRTSLHTVLELKSKELTQLRTKVHEQGVQLENKQAIEKRVEMTENRNQQLSYRLRQIQMTEKVAVIERDQFKEQVIQLERDNCQMKFENETLRYSLRQRAASVSTPSDNSVNLPPLSSSSLAPIIPCLKRLVRHRACSLSARILIRSKNDRTSRSLSSLNCVLYR